MRRLTPLSVLVVMATGCYAGYTWEDFSKGGGLTIDAPDTGAPTTADAGSSPRLEAGTPEAGIGNSDAGDAHTCMAGLRIFGEVAFDATVSNGSGQMCDPNAALTENDDWTGLDHASGGTDKFIDGQKETGCVGIELLHSELIASITVRAGPSDNACGSTPCANGNCGSGHSIDVFAGTTRDSLKFLRGFDKIDQPMNLVADGPSSAIQVIVACREAYGGERDDMLVDVISAVCK